jgi:hypothetical protein
LKLLWTIETLLATGLQIINCARASDKYYILKDIPPPPPPLWGKKSNGLKSEEKDSKIPKSLYIW